MLLPLALLALTAPAAEARVLPVDPPAPKLRAAIVEALEGRLDPTGRPLAPQTAEAPDCPRDELECLQSAAGAVDGAGERWVIAPAVFAVDEQRFLELTFVGSGGDAGTRLVPLDDDAPARALDGVFPRLSPGPYAILVDGVSGAKREALRAALGDALAGQPRIDPAQVEAARRAAACEGECLAKIGAACGARHVVRAAAQPQSGGKHLVNVEIVRVEDDTEVARSVQTWSGGALGPIVDPQPQTRVMVAGEGRGLIYVDGQIAARAPQVAPLAGVEPGDREIELRQSARPWRAVVPIRAGGVVEVAAPAAPPRAVEAALGPSEILGKPRLLVAGLGGSGDLERRVADAVRDYAPELEVRIARELRGGLDCPDVPCAMRMAQGVGAGRLLVIERVFHDGQRRVSLSRLDGQRVKTVEVREDALHAGVGAVLDRAISPWPYVGAVSLVAGVGLTITGLVLGGVAASEDREAQSALTDEQRELHAANAANASVWGLVLGGVGVAALITGGVLVWGLE